MLYRSDRTGAFEIWISDRDGRNSQRLTHFNGPMVNSPAWSPDGKQVAFECRPQGHSDICIIAADGKGDARRFTQWTSNEILPSWSRDGRTLYFTSNYSGRWEIYRQAIDGGEPIVITHGGGMRAVESWDGRDLYVHRGQPLGGMISLPVAEKQDAASSNRAEDRVFLSELSGGMWGDWDAAPAGIAYLTPTLARKAELIATFNPLTGSGKTLLSVPGDSNHGERIFSVEPGGKSFVFVKTEADISELGLLERHTRGGF